MTYNSRRLVIKQSLMHAAPKSATISNQDYRYRSQLPNYNWKETAIKHAVGIVQEKASRANLKTAFEDKIHDVSS